MRAKRARVNAGGDDGEAALKFRALLALADS
jgi:hypothetical protein